VKISCGSPPSCVSRGVPLGLARRAAVLFLLGVSAPVLASSPSASGTIEVGEDRPVAARYDTAPLIEPHLAVDPADGKHLLAASIVLTKPDISQTDCASFVSFDTGATWSHRTLGLSDCADVWTAFASDGSALLSVLGAGALLVYRSGDGGRTWSKPLAFDGNLDHETLFAASSGPVYLVASQDTNEPASGKHRTSVFVARSDDGGRSFAEPTRFFPSNLGSNAMTLVILSDGAVLASFADYQRPGPEGPVWLEPGRSWMAVSRDKGKTFAAPMMISDACGRGFPSLAVDSSSGPTRDRLYWLCNTQRFEEILLHRSADRGETWSKPVRVNVSSGRRPYVRTPSIAVNKDGVVGITWYDARHEKLKFKDIYQCVELYFAASLDGGETFLPDVKVSSAPSCADAPRNGLAKARWPAGGDYTGLAARPDGSFHLLWSDSRDGMYRLRQSVVKVDRKAAAQNAASATK